MSRARDLSKLGNPGVFSVSADNNVGVNSTAPVEKLNVVGVVSATAFYGDGSNLEGVASAGLGTAVEENSIYGGEQIYFTNTVLSIGGTVTVNPPDSSNIAYTQYQEISVEEGADFIVGDGDDFISDILGISSDVQQPGLLAGGGGRVRADNFSDKSGIGAPTFSSGLVVTGVATATSFSGNATGLSGTPDITVGDITANNISIGGTLTYEDVTNIDSIGIITARQGIIATGGKIDGRLGNFSETVNTIGNTGATCNINVASGTHAIATLDQDTQFSFTSPTSGSLFGFTLQLTNGTGGPFTIIWPNSVKWSNNTTPIRTTTDGRTDIWSFFTSDGGTNWYGSISLYNFVG